MASSLNESTESTTHDDGIRERTDGSSSSKHTDDEDAPFIKKTDDDTVDCTCTLTCTCMGDVICQWIARILLFFLVGGSLFASRLSFAILVAQFGSELNDTQHTNVSGYGGDEARSQSDSVFWPLLIVVCVPYVLNFLRCAYRGLTRLRGMAYPWPGRGEMFSVRGCVGHHVWRSLLI